MGKYEEMRKAVLNSQQIRREINNSWHGTGKYDEIVGGIRFAMKAIQQSTNGHRAAQVLHYVDGKRVNEKFFRDALSQVLPRSAS